MTNRAWRRSGGAAVAVVTVAMLLVSSSAPALAHPPGVGSDISWPQCGRPFPADASFGIVGVNDGKPFTDNPCFAAEYQWATGMGTPGLYINTANPGPESDAVNWYGQKSPNPACSTANEAACAYNYGYTGAAHAFAYASSAGAAGPHTWWLDVETGNSWSSDFGANFASVAGSIDYLRTQGAVVGIYSTRYQWTKLTGGVVLPAVPNWVAGARDVAQAGRFCADHTFTAGPVMVVQYVDGRFDHDVPCPGAEAVLHPTAGPPAEKPDLLRDLLRALGLAPKG